MSEESTQALALDFFESSAPMEVDGGARKAPPTPWGRLVSLNPAFPSLDLVAPVCILGRAKSATLQVKHQMVSLQHCTISRQCDDDFDLVFITDSSSNGTFVGGTRLPSGTRKLLNDGDEIGLLPPCGDPSKRVCYMFKLLAPANGSSGAGIAAAVESKYDVRDVLGTGNFASVRLAIEKTSGRRFAVKVIDKKKHQKQAAGRKEAAMMDEVRILQSISHANIIGIHDVIDTDKTLYIVLELVTGGELLDRINDLHGFDEPEARRLFRQLLDAVDYLHARNIAHRDLKPENILFESKLYSRLKLSDFGLSRVAAEGSSSMQTLCGTPQYIAPEVLGGGGNSSSSSDQQPQPRGYGKAVDMWSLGAILYVMLSGETPFDESGPVPVFAQVMRGAVRYDAPVWQRVSPAARHLLRGLLCVDPARRLTVTDALAHSWITGDDFEEFLEQQRQREADAAEAERVRAAEQQRIADNARIEQDIEMRAKEAAERLRQEAELKRKKQEAPAANGSSNGAAARHDQHHNGSSKDDDDDDDDNETVYSPTKALKSSSEEQVPSSGATTTMPPPAAVPAAGHKASNETLQLPVCKYHPNCYRKNPDHFRQFSHPKGDAKAT